jgi:4-aminobutyrate aminotransferase-like enzyme
MIRSIAAALALLSTAPLTTETVEVRGRGVIDLASFACTDTPRSTIVQRVCYDAARSHLLVNVGGVYSEYCRLPAPTFEALVVAASMGQFFRQRIAAQATQFACGGAN